jgi:hypothetical protein
MLQRLPVLAPLICISLLSCASPGPAERPEGGPAERPDGAPVPPPADAWTFTLAPPEVLADRLAGLLWTAEPEADLIQRLRAVSTPAALGDEADRMLADPRARAGVATLFRRWLFLGVLETLIKVDPEGVLDPPLRQAMMDEAPALGTHLTLDVPGTLRDLLTAPFTFVNERLARHYGIPGVTGPELRRVSYPDGQNRVGVMTGAGVLTLFASLSSPSWPAKRGWLVSDPLLCEFPIRSLLNPPTLDPQKSIRQQMIDTTKDSGCQGCHRTLDSPGFAFIGFDSFGRWRPERGHGPGETAGRMPATLLPDEPAFEGPAELAELLAGRPETARCFASRWLELAVDAERWVEPPPAFERSLNAVRQSFSDSGHQLRPLVRAIVISEIFAAP